MKCLLCTSLSATGHDYKNESAINSGIQDSESRKRENQKMREFVIRAVESESAIGAK